jgi:hypothetical protein
MHAGVWWGNLKEGDHLQSLGIKWEDKGWEGVDWINVVHERDSW